MNLILFLNMHPSITLILVFIIGAIIGSFLNVVIYRYPIMLQHQWHLECVKESDLPSPEKEEKFNLSLPRSHCPHCKKPIAWYHNIPLFSFLFLRGRCRSCATPISTQYILVEIISAILPVLIVMHLGISAASFVLFILTWGLIVLSFIDYKHQFLPDSIVYILLWIGLLCATSHLFISSEEAIFSAVIGYLFLWTIAKMYFILRKKEGMGLGDCKMLAMLGAWTGLMGLFDTVFFSAALALIVCLILILFKKLDSKKAIPFGPFLAMAGWITIVYGQSLFNWIVR